MNNFEELKREVLEKHIIKFSNPEDLYGFTVQFYYELYVQYLETRKAQCEKNMIARKGYYSFYEYFERKIQDSDTFKTILQEQIEKKRKQFCIKKKRKQFWIKKNQIKLNPNSEEGVLKKVLLEMQLSAVPPYECFGPKLRGKVNFKKLTFRLY